MGCAPSVRQIDAVKPAENVDINNEITFTIDEKLKLKEVWVIVKKNNLKTLGDDIVSR